MSISFSAADWLALLTHFLSLSLLAIGGAITTAPAMHNYLVVDKLWLTDSQFTSSIALAQAAPGPNVLFIALLGWNVGLNAGGGIGAGMHAWWSALAGVGIAMIGILVPSTTLTFAAARWGTRTASCVQYARSSRVWRPLWWRCSFPRAGFWRPARVAPWTTGGSGC